MSMISIDPQLCSHCGICTQICPVGIILPEGENNVPFMPDAMDNICIKCGNCEAFCPQRAISPLFSTKHSIVSNSISHNIGPEYLGAYMRKRRSVRNYRSDIVDRSVIEKILDIVRYAPSGVNMQPVNWLIIHDPAEVRKIASLTIDWMREVIDSDMDHPVKPAMSSMVSAYESGSDPICRGAPHLAIAYGAGEMAYTDSIIALSWFELAAPSFGLGACWGGFLKIAAATYQPLIDELALPEGYVLEYAMMFGYPEHEVYAIPGRNPAKIVWK